MITQYQAEIDLYKGREWDSILEEFEDSSIYQAWSYGEEVSKGRMPSTIVLKYDGRIVAACLLRIAGNRFLHSGFAYARWGPLWKSDGTDPQGRRMHMAAILHRLAGEYSEKRGLILKVLPHVHDDDESKEEVMKVLDEQGYVRDGTFEDRTILVDLGKDPDSLRKNLHQSWRRNLKKAENNGIVVKWGSQEEYLHIFRDLYKAMLRRKGYSPSIDLEQYIDMQMNMKSRMLTFLAYQDGSPCSGAIVSFMGNTAIYLFGATDDRAITLNSSYLVHWKAMEQLKEMGAKWYDLNGANPERNPEMYRFKDGLGGKERREVSFIGRYDRYSDTWKNRVIVKMFYLSKKTTENRVAPR
jgi:lipid II:glycine glycyltransferase (peptidoglycan interpeptide bridge formation enzyme)